MDKKSNVTKMGSVANNAIMISPRQALEDAIEALGKQNAFKDGKKIMIIALDESDGEYSISFIQAGMRMSECIALCEIAKSVFMEEMGYK